MKKVMVAMSGGVDSSVALLLLKEHFDVIGVTMKLHDGEYEINGQKSCCSLRDIEDAAEIASRFDVMHYVYNMKDLFRDKVIDRFISYYEQGFTPNPCVDCNRFIKFEALLDRAREIGCEYISTGHYARIEYNEDCGRWLLKKGISEDGENNKDQSYVLYDLTQEQLAHTIFPLGKMKKTEVREIAKKNGLINAHKSDSQDICFVTDGDYSSFIRRSTGKQYAPGDVTDSKGKVYGRHNGLINYTIGQRKGLGIAFGTPMYVIGKDMKKNTLIVGSGDELMNRVLTASELNWIAFERPEKTFSCKAKIRYRMTEQPCTVYPTDDDKVRVEFDEPQRAITPGQRVVFYDGDTVIGGGIIQN